MGYWFIWYLINFQTPSLLFDKSSNSWSYLNVGEQNKFF